MKNKLLTKLWVMSDRVDIWCKEKFNINPKQRALELKQDLNPNKRINHAIDTALGIQTDDVSK
jgi:hypothetical protein